MRCGQRWLRARLQNNVGGFACSCNDGFALADDGTSCDDVDECAVANGGCAQGCENNVGGFACSCNDGFALADDGINCDDVDECAVANGGCAQGCENNVGTTFAAATTALR